MRRLLFRPDPPAGGGGTPPAPTPAPVATPPAPAPEVRFVDINVEAIKQREGGADQAIRKLARENKKYRDKNAALVEERDQLKASSALKPGEVKLSADDAKKWEAFTKLGKSPEELGTVLKEHGEFGGKLAASEQQKRIGASARFAKYPNEAALADLIASKQLNLVLQKEQVDGREVEVPYIKPPGDNVALVKLTEYVDRNLALYKPALLAPPPKSDGTQDNAQGANGEARRTPWPEQSAGGGSSSGTPPASTSSPAGIVPVPGVQPRVLPSQRNAAPAPPAAKT